MVAHNLGGVDQAHDVFKLETPRGEVIAAGKRIIKLKYTIFLEDFSVYTIHILLSATYISFQLSLGLYDQ